MFDDVCVVVEEVSCLINVIGVMVGGVMFDEFVDVGV